MKSGSLSLHSKKAGYVFVQYFENLWLNWISEEERMGDQIDVLMNQAVNNDEGLGPEALMLSHPAVPPFLVALVLA